MLLLTMTELSHEQRSWENKQLMVQDDVGSSCPERAPMLAALVPDYDLQRHSVPVLWQFSISEEGRRLAKGFACCLRPTSRD